MKKTFLVILAILLVLPLAVSCTEKKINDENSVNYEVIAENQKCNYMIILPDKSSEAEKNCAMYVRDIISHYSGAAVELVSDWLAKKEDNLKSKEILIGNTNREQSAVAFDGDYVAKINGEKIVLNAKDENSLYFAVGMFVTKHIKNSENSVVKIPGDLKIEGTVPKADGWMLYAMPALEGVEYGEHSKSQTKMFSESGKASGSEYATVQYFSNATKEVVDKYIEALEEYGFVADSKIDHNGVYTVLLFRACAGREHRYTLILNVSTKELKISQSVPFDAQ